MSDDPRRLERPGWPVERVLDWIDDGCLLFDRSLRCVFANDAAGALFGSAPDRLEGLSLPDLPAPIGPRIQAAALRAAEELVHARVDFDEVTGTRSFEAMMYPSREGLLVLIADMTAARRRAREVAAHAEYLQQLVDQIPAFLWLIDLDLVVRRIEGGRPMLEALDRDRLVGLPMEEITRMGTNEADLRLWSTCIAGRCRAWPGGIAPRGRESCWRRASGRCVTRKARSPASSV